MKSKNKKCIGLMMVLVCLATFLTFNPVTASAAAGTKNEVEPNNTYTTATRTYDDYDNHGYISTSSDVDWWVISFSYSGPANFFLGSIPVGCDYDLWLYGPNGLTLIDDSLNGGNANELITYTVSANTNYYVKINSWLGSSTTSQYLFRAKVYPSKTLTTVPLYVQEATNTCGCASGRMILKSYGVTVTETNFKNKATALAGPGADFTYVYVIKDTINWYLSDAGNSTRYKFTYTTSYTDEAYKNLVLTNILNSHPVQPVLKITSTTYFPYTTSGHYVVIKGMTYSSSDGYYTAVVNDPHYAYCATRNVPISAIFSYNKAHSGYIICVD